MLTTHEFSRLRNIANAIVAQENKQSPTRYNVAVRPGKDAARVVVSLQSGTPRPDDPLTSLGSLCDQIVSELRLERTEDGKPIYATEESQFTSGDNPTFYF